MVHQLKLRFGLFILLGYYLPILLIWVGIIPFEFRFHTLVAMAIIMIAYCFLKKISFHDLGFRTDTFAKSLLWNSVLSVLLVLVMYLAYLLHLIRTPTVPSWNLFFFFYVLISCPAQEFIFRSVIFAEMKKSNIIKPIYQVAFSAITFSLLHIIYKDIITLSVGLFIGIIWGVIYYKYPNIYGVILSHSVLGTVSILVGLI
jgi:membrane protease YdiL (CAAX protease family)